MLSDGTFDLNLKELLTNTTPEKIDAALARAFLKNPAETSVNGFLVKRAGARCAAPRSAPPVMAYFFV